MKKIIIGIIIGIVICGLSVYAATIASSSVSYDNKNSGSTATNVQGALDDLYENSYEGKIKIAQAITNKGINTSETDSYDTIVSNINNISTGNPNLRYNEESGYIQAMNVAGYWVNIFSTPQLPIAAVLYNAGAYDPEYFNPSNVKYVLNYTNSNYIRLDGDSLYLYFRSANDWWETNITQFLDPIDTTKFTKLKVKAFCSGGSTNYIGLSTMEQSTIGQTVEKIVLTKDIVLEYEFDVTNYDSVYLTTEANFINTTAGIRIYKIWLE